MQAKSQSLHNQDHNTIFTVGRNLHFRKFNVCCHKCAAVWSFPCLFSYPITMPLPLFYDNLENLLRHVNTTHFKYFVFLAKALLLRLSFQKKSLRYGIHLFHQPDVHICLERIILFLRNMSKLRGYY